MTTLSPRQEQVLRRQAVGVSQKLIAAELGIAESTVHQAAKVAYRKIGGHRALQTYAAAHGWYDSPEILALGSASRRLVQARAALEEAERDLLAAADALARVRP